jgi:hypothetical protein
LSTQQQGENLGSIKANLRIGTRMALKIDKIKKKRYDTSLLKDKTQKKDIELKSQSQRGF